MASWGYQVANGPNKWHEGYPIAKKGKRQSPIDIRTETAVSDSDLRKVPLSWYYDNVKTINVENTGASWKVNVDGKGSCLKGGPLTGEYELWQYHAHWGNEDSRGSEHIVDGKSFPCELHLVHWNRSKYKSPNEAAAEPDGLAVLGIFLKVGKKHEELEKVCRMLCKIQHSNEKAAFDEQINASKFLPDEDKSFWTYEGSLTTPPLLESVIWTVFKHPVEISKEQLKCMRDMKCNCKEDKETLPMVDNYRPPVAMGTRTLRQI